MQYNIAILHKVELYTSVASQIQVITTKVYAGYELKYGSTLPAEVFCVLDDFPLHIRTKTTTINTVTKTPTEMPV